ncbi:hypothetical protein OG897_02610 [Streptomyces sp. NBC_00237]|uniref:hypothetical protein n=1 Tax=Streptomyces sp. NBC_00237 TaxID=2975687 RepID=UPI002259B65E|nr:hypothetical protein [Streptomyces sp. NBC_00237]MCX5200357.1 hypothetical protein [Streptomyces sp. NBC_00237]
MPALLLLSAVLVIGFEKFVEWRYGAAGSIGLLLLAIGAKAKSPACASVGATVLTVSVIAPAAP